jgi:hypothetical protein
VVLPPFVDGLKELSLLRELLLDVFSIENVFQIHPLALEGKPLIDDIRYVTKVLLPELDGSSDFSHVLRAHHCLNTHLIIFQLSNSVFDITDDESVLRVTIGKDSEKSLSLPEA